VLFRSKFFKDVLKITEDDASFIYGASFVVVAFGSVFWNYLADRSARPKMCVMVAGACMAGFFQLFLLVDSIPRGFGREFYQIFVIMIWTFAYSSLQPLMDAVVVHQLKIEGHGRELYGRQRLWGTVGYGLVTFVVAKAIDAKSGSSDAELKQQYLPMFSIVAATTGVFLILFYLLAAHDDPEGERTRRRLEQETKEREDVNAGPVLSKRDQLKALMSNPNFVFLLVITLFVGYGRQSLSMLRPLYTEERILGDDPKKKEWVSYAALTGLVFEVIIFFWGKPLLKKMGKYWLMVSALITIAVRLWAYVFIPEGDRSWIYFVLVVELLKGMSMGTLQVAAVQMCADVAGPDLQATAQGIYTGVFNGMAGVAGGMGSGAILKSTDRNFKWTFGSCAILTTVALGLVVAWPLIQKVMATRKK